MKLRVEVGTSVQLLGVEAAIRGGRVGDHHWRVAADSYLFGHGADVKGDVELAGDDRLDLHVAPSELLEPAQLERQPVAADG